MTEITNEQIISIWKTSVETQKHFAELSIKMRQLGLTLTGAVLAVAIILLKDDSMATIQVCKWELPLVSFVFLTAAGVLYAASILDVKVYHKMLRGAVKFNEGFENAHVENLIKTAGMTQTISAFSRSENDPIISQDRKSWTLSGSSNAGKKISFFYWIPIGLFVFLAIAFVISVNVTS